MTSHQESSPILNETIAEIRSQLGSKMDEIMVERAVIGLFFSGVKLSNGACGICFTPVKEIPESVCCPTSAAALPQAGRLKGKPAGAYLEEMNDGRPLKRALGIAVLNALSQACWKAYPPRDYAIEYDKDPLDDISIPDEAFVVVVGALVPYLRMLKKRGKPFAILEKDVRTLKEDELPFFAQPEWASEKISQADLLIVTGTTLIGGTLEGIVADAKPGSEIVVVGPSVSMLPQALFRRGVTSIGGLVCTDADRLLEILSEGGSGYHFTGSSARRTVIRPHVA
ncbi:MAG: DUF364 domain-containing protein [Syntrophaceae bacterium]